MSIESPDAPAKPVEAAPAEPVPANPAASERPKKRAVAPILLAVLVLVGAVFAYRAWTYGKTHISTDDAQVTSSIIQVSPQVAGTVIAVNVEDNAVVKKGDLLAALDPATYRTAVQQARANYLLAVAQAKEARVNVGLATRLGNAQTLQARGQLEQTQGAISGSIADVSGAVATVATARAQASGARSSVQGAVAGVRAAEANLRRAVDAVRQARTVVTNAEAAARAATANVKSSQATLGNAERNAQRLQSLFREGVISAQAVDQATTQLSVAQAQTVSAQEAERSAQALVSQRQTEVETAQSQVEAARAAVVQANAQVQANKDAVSAADQAVRLAQSRSQAAETSVQQARGRSQSAQGALAEANTAPIQVDIRRVGQEQAEAKVAQAKAALDAAELQLRRTRIYAADSGRVTKKVVTVGAQVQPGTLLMAIVPERDVWVVANFKETQLGGVREGQFVDIEVDGIPGVDFHGRVDSLAAGTGASFALLPPDNATGNFTKVVQRIPVKIVLEPGQPGLPDLRVGMSVIATVHVPEQK